MRILSFGDASLLRQSLLHQLPLQRNMSHFRAKKLDIGGFVGTKVLRDHTKRLAVF